MLEWVLQTGVEKIAEDIWQLLKQHPAEAVVIFLAIFVIMVLFFKFVVDRMSPYIAVLCFIIAAVMTPLILLALFSEVGASASGLLTSVLVHY